MGYRLSLCHEWGISQNPPKENNKKHILKYYSMKNTGVVDLQRSINGRVKMASEILIDRV